MFRHRGIIIAALVATVAALALLAACGTSETTAIDPEDNRFADLAMDGADSFDIITWNLRYFATDVIDDNDPRTTPEIEIAMAAEVIQGLGADLVAIQEIDSDNHFNSLLDQLPGWWGYQPDGYLHLAYVWQDSTVSVDQVFEIYQSEWEAFPRDPLLLQISWRGHDLLVINNHLKCCGDGQIEDGDTDDEEYRRLLACQLLEEWISVERPDDPVILLGDLNDRLTDAASDNVFAPFLDRPESYVFTDMAIATGPRADWSYGPGSSHIDHILVTDELFAAWAAAGAECRTIRIDQVLAGDFDRQLSDHLPVGLSLPGAALP
jgi:endonuclease/exonuclease/phosphatase family metal-dependent hydrolase